jgi:hypothetical protein
MMLGSPAVTQTDAGTATRQQPEDRESDIYSATSRNDQTARPIFVRSARGKLGICVFGNGG